MTSEPPPSPKGGSVDWAHIILGIVIILVSGGVFALGLSASSTLGTLQMIVGVIGMLAGVGGLIYTILHPH